MGYNRNLRPLQYVDEGGNCVGMHIDMLDWMAAQKGKRLAYIPYSTDSDCMDALRRKEIDILLGNRSNMELDVGLLRTGILSSGTLCMIARNDVGNSLKRNERYSLYAAGFEHGSIGYAYLSALGMQRYLALPSQEELYLALASRRVDVAVGVRECLMDMLEQGNLSGQYMVMNNAMSSVNYVMVVRGADRELYAWLQSSLVELRAGGAYNTLHDKWILDWDLIRARERMNQILTAVCLISAAVAAVLLFIALINRTLKRAVAEKTMALSSVNQALEERMTQLMDESALRFSIIENSPSGMVLLDSGGAVTLMNRAAMRIAGIRGEEPVGCPADTLPVYGDILRSLGRDIFSGQLRSSRSDTFVLERDGGRNSYRYNLYPAGDPHGNRGVLMSVEDVTYEEQKKQEVFELEKNKALNRIVAGIAHEIKNPLMSIRMGASLILSQGDDKEVQSAFGRFIPAEIDRINQLVEGLINYARPMKGQPEVLSLSELVRDTARLVCVSALGGRLRYALYVEDGLMIFGQKDQIKQALVNFFLNAIESIEKKSVDAPLQSDKPHLTIEAHLEKQSVVIRIRDEGVGMSEEELQRCTEPFFTTKQKGTGLGLALAQQFIFENSGRLSITSEKGSYTQVLITFRRYDVHEA